LPNFCLAQAPRGTPGDCETLPLLGYTSFVSYDLEVATHSDPGSDSVSEILRKESNFSSQGWLGGEDGNMLVLRSVRGVGVPGPKYWSGCRVRDRRRTTM